jgi:hypothetical protein
VVDRDDGAPPESRPAGLRDLVDAKTEASLKRLSVQRDQTKSEVTQDAIAKIADEDQEQLSAYDRLRPYIGIADSGGQQLSDKTGQRFRAVLAERQRARRAR